MNCFAHLSHDPTGIPNGTHVDVVGIVLPLLHRIVSHRHGGVSYIGNPSIAHHADNFDVRFRVAEALSQGTPVCEVTAGHGPLDHVGICGPVGVSRDTVTPPPHPTATRVWK